MTRPAYLSFDRFPAPKGSAVHIARFASALARAFGPLDLFTLPGLAGAAAFRLETDARVTRWPLHVTGETTIERALSFRGAVRRVWDERGAPTGFIHFRSIFEGYPIAKRKRELDARLVYEVNGLPSIELKYHYPRAADDRELLAKLRRQEQACLEAADLVLTPARVTAEHLVGRGVAPERVRVIQNGVDPTLFPWRAPEPPTRAPLKLLYQGTLAAWQGVLVAVEALALLRREVDARLTLVGPSSSAQRRRVLRRSASLGVADRVTLLPACSQQELATLLHAHDVALAPLMPNDRNIVQGCCPLKVLEAMAAGRPLIASRLPVVTDLAADGVDALLVRPGSARAIRDALLRLVEDPALALELAASARARVERALTWNHAERALLDAYREFGVAPGSPSSAASSLNSRSG